MIPIVKEGNKLTYIKYCLEKYLSAEEDLVGDNQCYCEGCNQKSDFRWNEYLHKVPPVLNIQLSHYCCGHAGRSNASCGGWNQNQV
jgi:hypothetical protein